MAETDDLVRTSFRLSRELLDQVDELRASYQNADGTQGSRSEVLRALVAEALRARKKETSKP